MLGRPATFAYSRERACCACSRCGTSGLYFFICFIYLPFLLSCLWETAEHDWNIVVSAVKTPTVIVSYFRGRPRLVLLNCLEGLSLPRNSATINWPAWHDLVVDWAVKLQHKQTKLDNFIVSASDYLDWRLLFFCNIYVHENLKIIRKLCIRIHVKLRTQEQIFCGKAGLS